MELIVILGILVVASVVIFGFVAAAQRRKDLAAWASANGLSFNAESDPAVEERFPEFHCLQQGSNRYAHNMIEGKWSGRPFLGFDYHYETHSTNSKGHRQTHHHHFSAVILGSVVPLRPLLIRPEGLLDKVTEFFGFDDIDFESAEFSRRFFVKAEDKRWAYDVIHQRTMEFLLSAPEFALEFASNHIIAYRSSTFSPQEFGTAAEVIGGVLDRLPDYLVQQQREIN